MHENELAKVVVDTAFRIHSKLGPGLLESVYQAILAFELRNAGLHVATEVPVSVQWDGLLIEVGFRADLVVENKLLVELKSIEQLLSAHKKQVLTYLRLTNFRLGLLINFGSELIKDGIVRIVNGLPDQSKP